MHDIQVFKHGFGLPLVERLVAAEPTEINRIVMTVTANGESKRIRTLTEGPVERDIVAHLVNRLIKVSI